MEFLSPDVIEKKGAMNIVNKVLVNSCSDRQKVRFLMIKWN